MINCPPIVSHFFTTSLSSMRRSPLLPGYTYVGVGTWECALNVPLTAVRGTSSRSMERNVQTRVLLTPWDSMMSTKPTCSCILQASVSAVIIATKSMIILQQLAYSTKIQLCAERGT